MKTRTRGPERNNLKASTLLTVVAMIMVVSILLLAYMSMVVQRAKAISRSQSWNLCVPVAEAGIEEAMAHLNHTRGRNMGTNGWDFIGSEKYSNFVVLGSGGSYSAVISNPPPVTETRGTIKVVGIVKVPGGGTISNEVMRSFLVRTLFRPGIDGLNTETRAVIKGNSQADSYDSRVAPYDPRNPGDKTFIGNNSTQPNQFEISGSAKVLGDVATGAAGGLKIDKPAVVGDASYANDNRNQGNVQPGHYSSGLDVPVTPVPSVPFPGNPPMPPGRPIVLGSGNFKVNGTLEIQGNEVMTVTGAATLWVTDTLVVKDNSQIVIAPGATLTVYVQKQFYTIGNAQINTAGRPQQFSYFGMTSNAEFYMNGNSRFVGTVYSPQAKMDISGDAEFFGGGHVYDLVLAGNSRFHFDESLRHQTGQPFTITSWEEL